MNIAILSKSLFPYPIKAADPPNQKSLSASAAKDKTPAITRHYNHNRGNKSTTPDRAILSYPHCLHSIQAAS
jgi:hypothetical protein